MKQTKVSAALVAAIYELGFQAAENEQQLRDEIAYWRNIAEDKIMAEADVESQPDDAMVQLAIFAKAMAETSCEHIGVCPHADTANGSQCNPAPHTHSEQPSPIPQAAQCNADEQVAPRYKSIRTKDWLKFVKEVHDELTNGVTITYHNGVADISPIINMSAAEVKREMYNHAAMRRIAKTYLWLQHQWRMRNNICSPCATDVGDLAQAVADHIEHYTVPQYGDAPDDNVEKWTAQDCLNQIGKYLTRFDTNQRGDEEAKRDILKIAHYLQLYHSKY